MQIELYSGDVPYIGLNVHGVQCFIPFRHTLEFFTKSPDHDMWNFDGMDQEEFTQDMRKINDWNFILSLDRKYNHGTMICCLNETIHGNRFSIHSKKDFRLRNNLHLDFSLNIADDGKELQQEVYNSIQELLSLYPLRCTIHENMNIKPEGRVCVYPMNCLKYKHTL
tara:strand:+ start:2049 stop:2549 length:501 start_codon:yes stop_codon:yes gene_type:complete